MSDEQEEWMMNEGTLDLTNVGILNGNEGTSNFIEEKEDDDTSMGDETGRVGTTSMNGSSTAELAMRVIPVGATLVLSPDAMEQDTTNEPDPNTHDPEHEEQNDSNRDDNEQGHGMDPHGDGFAATDQADLNGCHGDYLQGECGVSHGTHCTGGLQQVTASEGGGATSMQIDEPARSGNDELDLRSGSRATEQKGLGEEAALVRRGLGPALVRAILSGTYRFTPKTIDPRILAPDPAMGWRYTTRSRLSMTASTASNGHQHSTLETVHMDPSHRLQSLILDAHVAAPASDAPPMPESEIDRSTESSSSTAFAPILGPHVNGNALVTPANNIVSSDTQCTIPTMASELDIDSSMPDLTGNSPRTDPSALTRTDVIDPSLAPLASLLAIPEASSNMNHGSDSTTLPNGSSYQPNPSSPIIQDPPVTTTSNITSTNRFNPAINAIHSSLPSLDFDFPSSPPLNGVDRGLIGAINPATQAQTGPADSSSASSRLDIKHRKLVEIFPDDYQARMRTRGIKWFGINALGAYLSIYASLTRMDAGIEKQDDDAAQGQDDQHGVDVNTASGTMSIQNSSHPETAGRHYGAETADRQGQMKERALNKVCKWVEKEVFGKIKAEEVTGPVDHSTQVTERALKTLYSMTSASAASSGKTLRNGKKTRSADKAVNKDPQTTPKQPLQQRLVIAAADLAWKVKQRNVRERSEDEDRVDRNDDPPPQSYSATTTTTTSHPQTSDAVTPVSSRVPNRTPSARKPPSTPYLSYIPLPTGQSDRGSISWPPDDRDRVELAVCATLPEAQTRRRLSLARNGCVTAEEEDIEDRDNAVSSDSSFEQESRVFESRWKISVRSYENPLDRFSASTTMPLSLPSLPPCFPTRTYAEQFLADVVQHVARTSRPDGQTSHSIFRQLNDGDFATTYRGNPFNRLPVVVWIKDVQPPEEALPYVQLAGIKDIACVVEQTDTAAVWKRLENSGQLSDGVQEIWNSAWRLTGRRVTGLVLSEVEAVLREIAHARCAVASHREVARQFGGPDSAGTLTSSTTLNPESLVNDPTATLWSAGTFDYHPATLTGKVWTLASGWALLGVLNLPPEGQIGTKAIWELGLVGPDTTLTLPFDTTAFFMYLSDSITLETEWRSPVYAKPLYKIIEDDTVLRPDLLGTVTKMAQEAQRTTTTTANLKALEDILQHGHRLSRLEERRNYRILLDQHRIRMAKVQTGERL